MNETQSMQEEFLALVNGIIEENISNENFSVEDLAALSGVSRSMLHRKLIKAAGKSASDLIREKRLLKAKELLENDVATASEIAYRVGFKSPSYFNKVFKKHFNISPGEVRKKSNKNHVQSNKYRFEDWSVYRNKKRFGLLHKKTVWLIIVLLILAVSFVVNNEVANMEKSVAVLPINNLTGQPNNDFFVAGIHDALIGELGKLSNLRVISRKSTLRYQHSDMLLKDIAKELRVKIVVEASLVSLGDSLKLLIQVIDVFPKEQHLLSTEYNEELKNVLKVYSVMAKDIAHNINLKLTKSEEERLLQSHEVDPETYLAYVRGMHNIYNGTFEKGIKYLLEAIDRDPGDPHAYAGLALGYATVGHGMLNTEEAFLSAESAANMAIKLDPTIDNAYTALALLYLYNSWDWPMAKEAFENAVSNNPNNSIAHAQFAWYYALYSDFDKAIYHGKKAAVLNPWYVSYSAWLALLYYHNKEYNRAEYWARKALDFKDDVPYGNLVLGLISIHNKEYQQAIEFHEKLPATNYFKTMLGYAYVKAGQGEKAMIIWDEMEEKSKNERINPCYRGMMAAYLGLTDKAFELLNDACENKNYPINYINYNPCIEDIRGDTRFNELLQKMNLPTN